MTRTTVTTRRAAALLPGRWPSMLPSALPGLMLGLLLGLLLAPAVVLLPAGAAHAAAYRYWGYYQLDAAGSWQFATKGPDQTDPADGSVEGWRYAVSSESSSRTPRATADFAQVCGAKTADAGQKRIAVVIDYGRPADYAAATEPPAPVGRCAVVDEAATGAEVLAAVAEVRSDKGLVCGIDGLPATGCGDEVKQVSADAEAADTPVTLTLPSQTAAAAPDAASSEDGSHTGTYLGIGLAVLAAAAVGAVALRRRSS